MSTNFYMPKPSAGDARHGVQPRGAPRALPGARARGHRSANARVVVDSSRRRTAVDAASSSGASANRFPLRRPAASTLLCSLLLLAACDSGESPSPLSSVRADSGVSTTTAAIVAAPENQTHRDDIIQILTPGVSGDGLWCSATIVGNRMILTAMHCLCDMTRLADIEIFRRDDTMFDARFVAELGRSNYCDTGSQFEDVEGEKDIALLVTNRSLDGIIAPQDTASFSTGSLNGSELPLNVTSFGYGYSTCEETGGDGTQRSASFTFLYREPQATVGVLVPPTRAQLSGTAHGDSGGPVYDSSLRILGVNSIGDCPFYGTFALLDDRAFATDMRDRVSATAADECTSAELAYCEGRGADSCLQVSGAARCIRYVAQGDTCPSGYTDHATPAFYEENICVELPSTTPPSGVTAPPGQWSLLCDDQGLNAEIQGPGNIIVCGGFYPPRYATSSGGELSLDIIDTRHALFGSGDLIVATSRPLSSIGTAPDYGWTVDTNGRSVWNGAEWIEGSGTPVAVEVAELGVEESALHPDTSEEWYFYRIAYLYNGSFGGAEVVVMAAEGDFSALVWE